MKYLLVFVGGGVGSVVRYVTGAAIMSRLATQFPAGTMVINVAGSFLIGLVMTLLTERLDIDPNWRFLAVTGFLGGYTTFSTFEWETYMSVREGSLALGTLYVLGSVLLGFAGVVFGAAIARR